MAQMQEMQQFNNGVSGSITSAVMSVSSTVKRTDMLYVVRRDRDCCGCEKSPETGTIIVWYNGPENIPGRDADHPLAWGQFKESMSNSMVIFLCIVFALYVLYFYLLWQAIVLHLTDRHVLYFEP